MTSVDEPLVLAVDVGTSRIKGCLVGSDGELIGAPAVRPTSTDPDSFLSAVAGVIDEIPKEGVDAVALSVYWHGLLPLDGRGDPMQEISTWQETWASWAAEDLRSIVDPQEYHQQTGCFLHPSYPMVRLYADTDLSRDASHIGGPAEWLFFNFFSDQRTSRSMASATGLTDIEGDYLPGILDLLGISREQLPVISSEPSRGLRDPWDGRWPQLASVPWHLAIGDGAAGAVGSGCLVESRAALNLGTSAAVRAVVTELSDVPDSLFVYKVAHDGPWLVGGAVSNAANLIDWAERTLQLGEHPVTAALARPWGSHGLEAKPHLAGARSPWWAPTALGRIDGIDMQTDPLDLLQSLIEAATEDLVEVVRRVDTWIGKQLLLIASGGLVEEEPSWTKLIEKRIGRRLFKGASVHAGLRGAAMLALADLGVTVGETEPTPI